MLKARLLSKLAATRLSMMGAIKATMKPTIPAVKAQVKTAASNPGSLLARLRRAAMPAALGVGAGMAILPAAKALAESGSVNDAVDSAKEQARYIRRGISNRFGSKVPKSEEGPDATKAFPPPSFSKDVGGVTARSDEQDVSPEAMEAIDRENLLRFK